MTLTSPPYDGLKDYGGHLWDHEKFALISHELWRVTKPGGVVCWVVRDQIKKGSQTGTSFKQAIFFLRLGFLWHNTLIIEKQITRGLRANRYGLAPEFCFVFSKGRPRTATLLKEKNKFGGHLMRFCRSDSKGNRSDTQKVLINEYGNRGLVWRYATGSRATAKEPYAYEHPALMPEKLAHDLILSWSRPGDVVLDPMSGGATTAKMALLNDRQYLGFEIHEPYHELAIRRMADAHHQNNDRLDRLLWS